MNESQETKLEMTDERKFQALTMLYQGHAELLRFMTTHDLQIFGGYITIQLALGSWLSQQQALTGSARFAIAIIDATLAFIAATLIRKAYERRSEIHHIFKNLNRALLFKEKGAYLPDDPLMPPTKFRPWHRWYILGIGLAFVGIALLLIVGGPVNVTTATPKP